MYRNCVQSAVKGESQTQGSVPVHVYGPEGVADFLDVVLATSDTCLFVPVIVFEFVPGPVEDGFATMECLNSRSRLHRVRACTAAELSPPRKCLGTCDSTAVLSPSRDRCMHCPQDSFVVSCQMHSITYVALLVSF